MGSTETAQGRKIERQVASKNEYLDGAIRAMSGVSRAHSLINSNLARLLGAQLLDRSCEMRISDMRVKVSARGLYTYSDIAVVCGEPQYEDVHVDTLLNPTVIMEVLSPSTEAYDRGTSSRIIGSFPPCASISWSPRTSAGLSTSSARMAAGC